MALKAFSFTREPIDPGALRTELTDPVCGGYAAFEGWVRDHNEGQRVTHLEYEAFEPLAIKEGERIVAEAVERFGIEHAACVHRVGDLPIGEMAVWVGVSAKHRDEAFKACRYIIDEVKHRVPIWKKEYYENGDSGWVNCERCATAAHDHHDAHEHKHAETHEHVHAHEPEQEHELMFEPAQAIVPDYSRQMALKEVGASGQAKLRASRVLVIGAGGLGVPVLMYLVGAGVGRIGIVDSDSLEPSNLHRQTLYSLNDVGKPKAELAAARLRALNPDVDVQTHVVRLNAENGPALIEPYELVIDCTDNFSTKFLLNDLCVRLGKPAILSSVYQYEGQLQVIRPDRGGSCLRCIWPEATRDGLVGNCSEAGVLGPVPGVFGSLQALEALKVLLDLPGQLRDEVLVFDLTTLTTSHVRARRAAECQNGSCARVNAAAAEAPPPSDIEVVFDTIEDALDKGYFVVDIREPHEVAAAPLGTNRAQNIPLSELLHSTEQLSSLEKYLLVCASGRRSLAAAQELRQRGLEQVKSLRGGVNALRRRAPA